MRPAALPTVAAALLLALLAGCSAMDEANRRAERDTVQTIVSDVPFDGEAARAQLEPGNTKLVGVAFLYWKKNPIHLRPFQEKVFAKNTTIYLLPVTDHLLDWQKLYKKKQDARHNVVLSNEALQVQRSTVSDYYGRFEFDGLKPGRYYLTTHIVWSRAKSRDVYTGSGYDNYGGQVDYYQREDYVQAYNDNVETIITIKETDAGQTVEVELSN